VQFFFSDHRLDTDRRELLRGSEQIAVEPQVFDLLVFLLQNRDRVVSKDDLIGSIWGGRIISESTLTSRINAARKAVGDTGEEQKVIRTIARKGFRFVGDVNENAAPNAAPNATDGRKPSASLPNLKQEIHFCAAHDGVRIAYASVGQGPPLVKTANWLNHLEFDWESPIWRHLLHALASERRLIRYDERGNGLSDWDAEDISFEAFVNDLESVIDACGIDRFPLLGMSQGCAVAIAYAVRHPERVSHLVLFGGFARGRLRRGSGGVAAEQHQALMTLVRHGWGQENPAFRQIFTSQFLPRGTIEQNQWFNDLQRKTTSPENAVRIMQTLAELDVTGILSRVQAPTLVLHCRNDARVDFEEGRLIAAGIPGARFVALEGNNHIVLEDDPGRARLLEEIRNFLSE